MPQGGRSARGKPIVNLVQLEQGEKINAILPVKAFDENRYIFMATSFGTVKRHHYLSFPGLALAGSSQ